MQIHNQKTYEEAAPWSMESYPKIRKWLYDDDTFKKLTRTVNLFGFNKKRFKKLWGRQTFCWTSWCRFWVWVHELPDCELVVLTGTPKGTCYEVHFTGDKDKAVDQVIEFLENMEEPHPIYDKDTLEAASKLVDGLKSGEITKEDIRNAQENNDERQTQDG